MGRDVEVDVTANDKTGPALASVERKFRESNDKIKREQDKASKAFGDGFAKNGAASAAKVGTSFADSLREAGSKGMAGIAIAAAVNAPLIGGVIAGAITAGIGTGVAGIGVALAAQDTRVQQAAKDVFKGFESRAEQAAGVFIKPVLSGLKIIDAELDKIDVAEIFRDASKFVEPLATSFASAAGKLGEGIADAVDNGAPAVESLGGLVDDLGGAFGEMFSTLSEDSEIGAAALDDLAQSLVYVVQTTTGTIQALVAVKSALDGLDGGIDNFRYKLEDALSIGNEAGLQFDITADGLSNMERRANQAADGQRRLGEGTFGASEQIKKAAEDPLPTYEEAVKAANDAAAAFTSTQQSLYSATTGVAEASARASETIAENGKTLSLNSEKGRENREALSSVAAAMTRQYEATVKANGVGAESYGVASRNSEAFIKLASKAGLSAGAARDLATQLGLIPSKRETQIKADTDAAKNRLSEIQGRLANINSKTVTVTVISRQRTDRAVTATGKASNRGGLTFDANHYFAAAGEGGGMYRTGGPAQVDVTSNVDVYLDGEPFRAMTVEATRASERRQAWRQRVGGRAA